jgi:long-chain acyl-CoA synthetase
VWLNEDAVTAHLGDVSAEGRDAARRALVQKRIDQINTELASYETIKKFAILTEPLSVENELLTASLKVRRKKVNERFASTFEGMYEQLPNVETKRPSEAQP